MLVLRFPYCCWGSISFTYHPPSTTPAPTSHDPAAPVGTASSSTMSTTAGPASPPAPSFQPGAPPASSAVTTAAAASSPLPACGAITGGLTPTKCTPLPHSETSHAASTRLGGRASVETKRLGKMPVVVIPPYGDGHVGTTLSTVTVSRSPGKTH